MANGEGSRAEARTVQQHGSWHKVREALAQLDERTQCRGIKGRQTFRQQCQARTGVAGRRALARVHCAREGETAVFLCVFGAMLGNHLGKSEPLLARPLS
jgi:hypothetical protein